MRWRRRPSPTSSARGGSGSTACSPAGSGDAKGGSKGPLVIARTVDLDQLDPAVATSFGSVQTLQLIFDTLLRTDANGRFVPDLAKTWETSADGRTLTFHLRQGVKFHNGDPLTSDAVVATLNRLRDEATASVVRSNLAAVSDVTAPDPGTVVIKLSRPDASVLNTLTLTATAVLDPADIKAGRVAKSANGSGPFKLAGRTQGQKADLTANAAYFGGKPKLPGVEFRLHGTTLYNSIYRADDEMLANGHLYGVGAYMAPVLHLRRVPGGELFDAYAESVEKAWESARPISSPSDWEGAHR